MPEGTTVDAPEVVFREHAALRMFQRSITQEAVLSTIANGDTVYEPDEDHWDGTWKMRRRV